MCQVLTCIHQIIYAYGFVHSMIIIYAFLFRHLGSQLSEMAKVIEQMMQADFIDFAINILNQPHSADVKAIYEEDRLLSVVLGLIRQKKLKFLHMYRTECFTVIKGTIKQVFSIFLCSPNIRLDKGSCIPVLGFIISYV